jgi:hypothetical protein
LCIYGSIGISDIPVNLSGQLFQYSVCETRHASTTVTKICNNISLHLDKPKMAEMIDIKRSERTVLEVNKMLSD